MGVVEIIKQIGPGLHDPEFARADEALPQVLEKVAPAGSSLEEQSSSPTLCQTGGLPATNTCDLGAAVTCENGTTAPPKPALPLIESTPDPASGPRFPAASPFRPWGELAQHELANKNVQ